uniref:Uncharacterized protein n=1 Tax=Panagrolaimus sp. PS1159 TaxID=55785 RepID=A0AC35G2P5_9BILA
MAGGNLNSVLLNIFITFSVMILIFSLSTEAAPTSDSANAYRILSNYMRQFNDPEQSLDSAGYIIFDDKSSIKRALGPRPLRFG